MCLLGGNQVGRLPVKNQRRGGVGRWWKGVRYAGYNHIQYNAHSISVSSSAPSMGKSPIPGKIRRPVIHWYIIATRVLQVSTIQGAKKPDLDRANIMEKGR